MCDELVLATFDGDARVVGDLRDVGADPVLEPEVGRAYGSSKTVRARLL